MMQKIFLFLILYFLFDSMWQTNLKSAVPAGNLVPAEKKFIYHLGNKRIPLQILKYGQTRNIVMISLHDDETTAVKAAKKVLEKTGGLLIRIENDNKRYVTFSQKGKTFRFDPNRIFTKKGIRSHLREQNISTTNETTRAVSDFAKFVLGKIPSARTYIALHNNDDGGLSLLAFMRGGRYEQDVSAVHKNEKHDPDNFFLTTDKRLFRSLKSTRHNVILQNNRKAADDGSLSIYYGRKNKSYINVEAEPGMIAQQQTMIEAAVRIINHQGK